MGDARLLIITSVLTAITYVMQIAGYYQVKKHRQNTGAEYIFVTAAAGSVLGAVLFFVLWARSGANGYFATLAGVGIAAVVIIYGWIVLSNKKADILRGAQGNRAAN